MLDYRREFPPGDGGYYPDRETAAVDTIRYELTNEANKNNYLMGPMDFHIVQDDVGPRSTTYRAMVGWAPIVRNVHPRHAGEVLKALGRYAFGHKIEYIMIHEATDEPEKVA